MLRNFRFALFLCLILLAVAACGGGDEGADASTTSQAVVTTTSAAATSTTQAPVTTTTEPIDPTELLMSAKHTNKVDGKFVASGGAVDAGVMCPEGGYRFKDEIVDEDPGVWFDSLITSEYTCSDGSGTFTLELTDHVIISGSNSSHEGPWAVLTGTGAYTSLQGEGEFEGSCTGAAGCDAEAIGVVTP